MSMHSKVCSKVDSDVEQGEDSKSDDDADAKKLGLCHTVFSFWCSPCVYDVPWQDPLIKPGKCRWAGCICKAFSRICMELFVVVSAAGLTGCLLIGIREFTSESLSGQSGSHSGLITQGVPGVPLDPLAPHRGPRGPSPQT